jgi:pyrroline-5-carboxylate reductase
MIGAGNMGQAIIDGWRAAGIELAGLTVVRPSGIAIDDIRTVTSVAEAGAPPRLVLLAVKPQKIDEVAAALRPRLSAQSVIVSILAGVDCESLRARFPGAKAIVRAMPNLPVSVRRGVIAMYSAEVDEALKRELAMIFQPLGFAPWMVDEARFSAVGAVSGAGPAYVARFIAALTKAGIKRGLSQEMAETVALETVFGTAWMAAGSGEAMDSIAKRVASPKGTTEAGLKVLDHDHVLDELIAVAIDAAGQRGEELSTEARGPLLAAEQPLH